MSFNVSSTGVQLEGKLQLPVLLRDILIEIYLEIVQTNNIQALMPPLLGRLQLI